MAAGFRYSVTTGAEWQGAIMPCPGHLTGWAYAWEIELGSVIHESGKKCVAAGFAAVWNVGGNAGTVRRPVGCFTGGSIGGDFGCDLGNFVSA